LNIYDANPPPATSTKLGTITTLVSSKDPVGPGESYTVTATVAPGAPTGETLDGTVTFTVGAVVGQSIALDGNHSASITLTAPSGLTRRTVRARYNGNARFLASTGSISVRIANPTTPGTAATPAPRDTKPPVFSAGVTRTRLARALRRGIRVHIDCDEGCSTVLKLSVSAKRARQLGMRPRSASVVLARGGREFPDAKVYTATVRFSPRARRALAKAQRVVLRLTTIASDLNGNHSVRAQTVTLKR
jgi:hypothetical protein